MKTNPVLLLASSAIVAKCALSAGAILASAAPFTWLWNRVPVVIFQVPRLGYWQSVGLLLLLALAGAAARGANVSLNFKAHGDAQ